MRIGPVNECAEIMRRSVWAVVISLSGLFGPQCLFGQPTPEDVVIDSSEATLAGTLLRPVGEARGMIVMVTGSGPHSRDQVISGTPMFAEIADMLAAIGWASLRIDERGVGESTGQHTENLLERVPDVVATIEYAANLNIRPLGLLGHSQGALVATLAERERSEEIAFLILLGAPAARGDRVFIDQQMAINTRGSLPDATEGQLAEAEAALTRLARETMAGNVDGIEAATRALFRVWEAPDEVYEDGTVAEFVEWMSDPARAAFFRHDPAPVYAASPKSRLAIYGSLDVQASPELNAPILMSNSAPEQTELVILPDLGHFFLRADGVPPGQHVYRQMKVASELGEAMAAWLAAKRSSD